MIRVTITRTDVGEWTGEHDKHPFAAYVRALVQAYPNPTSEPPDLREQWLGAAEEWKRYPRCSRLTATNRAHSVHVMIEKEEA